MTAPSVHPAPAAPFDPATIDPNREYDVVLTTPVELGAARLLPRHDHVMTGAFLALIVKEAGAHAIDRATVRL